MAVSKFIVDEPIRDLYLDPQNPRLGRSVIAKNLNQDQILEQMANWELEELIVSFDENGYWPQEALIVTNERLDGDERLVVVEGNRRLAALKLITGNHNAKISKRLENVLSDIQNKELYNLAQVPCIHVDNRSDVKEFLGFRHVSGIKQWEPAEKAAYIASLVDNHGFTYEQVMRKIGSKTENVRRNYISYKVLGQMKEEDEIYSDAVEDKFSVLYLSLRTRGVQQYLDIDINADPAVAARPVPESHRQNLIEFAKYLFGTETSDPLVPESRDVDAFGKILESDEALRYLSTATHPTFDTAYRKAGGDLQETVDSIERAIFELEDSLGTIHFFVDDERMQRAVKRLLADCKQIARIFEETDGETDGDT